MRSLKLACLFLATAGTAMAQDAETGAGLSIELNTINQVENGCQLTFLASSTHEQGIEQVVFESVLFDTNGAVNRMTLFDFGAIPANLPRVRQFVIPATQCADIGQILINGVNQCTASGLDANSCASGLTVTSRTEMEMLG